VDPPIPWQRVIGSSGTISSRGPGTDGAQRQKDALEAEGVEVNVGRTGELRVDLKTWGWFPNAVQALTLNQSIPSNDDAGSESDLTDVED
jgi:methylated-DNA-protein-cysteine methyltransferase-like protein